MREALMNKVRDLRRGSRASAVLPLRWTELSIRDVGSHAGLLNRVMRRQADGVTIRGVLSPAEIEQGLACLDGAERLPRVFGSILGMALGMSGTEPSERAAYHDDVDRSRALLRTAFGFDVHGRVAAAIAPLVDGMEPAVPEESGRAYNPGHVRWWDPGAGGLPAHVGNEFRRFLEHGSMRHLLTITKVADHLSYFVVLQRADSGGELSVYDLLWEDDDGLGYAWNDGRRDDAEFDHRSCRRFDLQVGDLVVFGGGWRWHRVEEIGPGARRVTYGGFAAPSLDGSQLHFWA